MATITSAIDMPSSRLSTLSRGGRRMMDESEARQRFISGESPESTDDSERQYRLRGHLEPAVEARLVIEELHPAARGAGLLDLDGQAEPAARAEDREAEPERDVQLGPPRRPGARGVGEVGEVGGQVDRGGVDRHSEHVQVALEEPEADLA